MYEQRKREKGRDRELWGGGGGGGRDSQNITLANVYRLPRAIRVIARIYHRQSIPDEETHTLFISEQRRDHTIFPFPRTKQTAIYLMPYPGYRTSTNLCKKWPRNHSSIPQASRHTAMLSPGELPDRVLHNKSDNTRPQVVTR